MICGCQAWCAGLLGNEEDLFDSLAPELAGHPMPGYSEFDENGNEIKTFEFPSQKEINQQNTPFLRACLRLGVRVKRFGNPHNAGWSQERNTVVEIAEIVDSEINRYESWRLKHSKDLADRD